MTCQVRTRAYGGSHRVKRVRRVNLYAVLDVGVYLFWVKSP